MAETTSVENAERVVVSQDALTHIDAYQEYYNLVGDTDNGVTLSRRDYSALKKRAEKAKENELFVYWRHILTGMDCKAIGPSSPCLCGHRYRDHAWFDTDNKKVHCRMRGCNCPLFEYIPIHGSRTLYCHCKHPTIEHSPNSRVCRKSNICNCNGFSSSVRCSCNSSWGEHKTVFETKRERLALGKPVARLFDGLGPVGGVTSHFSLADGVDQKEFYLRQNMNDV